MARSDLPRSLRSACASPWPPVRFLSCTGFGFVRRPVSWESAPCTGLRIQLCPSPSPAIYRKGIGAIRGCDTRIRVFGGHDVFEDAGQLCLHAGLQGDRNDGHSTIKNAKEGEDERKGCKRGRGVAMTQHKSDLHEASLTLSSIQKRIWGGITRESMDNEDNAREC